MSFEKYLVIHPHLIHKMIGQLKNDSHLSDLDSSLLKLIRNKKIDHTTKWMQYKNILKRYRYQALNQAPSTSVLPDVKKLRTDKHQRKKQKPELTLRPPSPPPPPPQPQPTEPKIKRKKLRHTTNLNKTTQTENIKPEMVDASTHTEPQANVEDIYESEANVPAIVSDNNDDHDEKRVFPDYSLEEFIRKLAQNSVPDSDPRNIKLRESSINSDFRIFDDLNTGAVLSVHVDDARRLMDADQEENTSRSLAPIPPPPPKKLLSRQRKSHSSNFVRQKMANKSRNNNNNNWMNWP